jgi:hypothetical protein
MVQPVGPVAPANTAGVATPNGANDPSTLVAAANAAPKLDSSSLVGVASTATSANDAAVKAQVTQAYQEAAKMADSLKASGVDFQNTFWLGASPALKSLLAAAGYVQPAAANAAPNSGGGFWHDIIHYGDDVRHAGSEMAVNTLVKPIEDVGKVFSVAGAPITQLMRDSMSIAQQQDMANAAGGAPGSTHGWFSAFNPVDLLRNWHSVQNGAESYQPEVVLYVQKEMGITGKTLELAKTMASGVGLQAALASVLPSQRASAYALIETTPKFIDAVQLLSDSHLSIGQAVFGGLNAAQTHQLYPDVSIGSAKAYALAGQGVGAAALGAVVARDPEAGAALETGGGATSGLLALKGLSTVRGAAAAVAGGTVALTSARAAIMGETPDVASTVSPFGLRVHPMSGVLDGLASWYLNPAFVGLQARGAYNSVAHAMSVVDAQGNAIDVGAKYLNQAPERAWAQKFVKAVTSPWLAEHGEFAPSANVMQASRMGVIPNAEWVAIVQREYPKFLEAAKSEDPDAIPRAVGTMLGDEQAQVNIMRGNLGAAMHGEQQYPHLTIPQRLVDAIKGVGEGTFQGKRFNPDAMSARELSVDAFGEPITADGMAIAEATDQKLGHAARFLRRPTNLVPEESIIRYADPNRIKLFQQYTAFSLPVEKQDELTNAFATLAPADEGRQFAAIKGMMNDVLHAGNVDRTPEGKVWMDQVLTTMDNAAGEGEMYADPRNPHAPPTAEAIFPPELADAVAMPSFQEYYKFAKKNWFMNQLQLRLNADLFDRFMSGYWKRAMLLRSGFALRFGGEEVLSHILRNGPASYVKGRVAASLYDTANPTKEAMRAAQEAIAETTQRELLANAGNVNAANEMDTAAAYQALASHVPDEVLQAVKTPEQFKASIQAWTAMNFLRRVGVAFVGHDVMAAAYNLARRGVLDSAFEDYIDAVRSHGTVYFGDIPKEGDERALIRHEDGTPLQFRPTGKFKSFNKEDADAIAPWSYRLSGIKNTEVGRGIARAHAFGGVDAQMQYATDWINGTRAQAKVDEATKEFNAAAAKWESAGKPEEGTPFSYLDVKQGNLDAAEAELERHQRLINKFKVNFQTREGGTIEAGTATREEIVRDWATSMVRKVNRLTMTREGQEFDAAGERIPINPDEPQPIRLLSTIPGKQPYQIATRDVGRGIEEVPDAELAYYNVPEDHVRLFRSENTFDAHEPPARAGQGRAWTPNYQLAVDRAGANGSVYKIDVPDAVAKEDYNFHGPEGTDVDAYLNEIKSAQHAGTPGSGAAPATDRGYFESGDVRHFNTEDSMQRTLIKEIGRGVVPSNDELSRIEPLHRPDNLSIPEQMVKANPGTLDGWLTKGMRNLVGRPANWLSRQPIFTHNYTNALNETTKMLAARGIEDGSGDLAHDIAMERAFNETIPYIHNPASKSQMSLIVRNIAPFWFAQEQFYKRWGRLFGTYPEAWYKLSLTMNGLRSVGFVFKDQYGKDAFVYPGSEAVLSLLARFPFLGSIPVGVSMTGEISQLNPTLTTGGAPLPSLGPIITIPLDMAGVALAHFGVAWVSQLAQSAAGPNAPQINQEGNWWLNVLEQVTPSIVNRLGTAVLNGAEGKPANVGDPIFMSTLIMAAQQLQVTGHGLTNEQEQHPVLVQQYMDRLTNWAKNLLFARAVFGFMAPTVPTFKIADGGLGAQLTALMAEMPYEQAVTAFIKAHPNATADTIFESTTSTAALSGTYVPATQQALNYMTTNAQFFRTYSQLAPWSIPANDSKGLFNSNVYEKEIALDLRTRRPLYTQDLVGSWYGEVKYAEGANVYYPMETLFQAAGSSTAADAQNAQATLGITQAQALAQLNVPQGTDVKTLWGQWSTDFKNTHVLFAQQETAVGAVSTARRGDIVNQLQQAIKNEALPPSEWSTRIEQLMAAYDKVAAAYPDVRGTAAATANKQAFLTWGTAFVQVYPSVAPIWAGVISKAIPG